MDNKELLKQLKNCIDLCDKLTKEKEELKIELEDQIRVSEELEILKEDVEKAREEIIKLNKDLS